MYVYIAGPLGDDVDNVGVALDAATKLLEQGHAPYVPHLSWYWHAQHPQPYETWMSLDYAWILRCDALLRLPGKSPGADEETAWATAHGIPVCHSVEEVLAL